MFLPSLQTNIDQTILQTDMAKYLYTVGNKEFEYLYSLKLVGTNEYRYYDMVGTCWYQ